MKFVWLRTNFNAPASGTVDSSDPWYYWCYDERWRMVATYRNSDSNPKERFVYHAAGFGGYGSSSYIDSVVLRDRDANATGTSGTTEIAWRSAGDGTLEERRYLCQNWRANVVGVIGPTPDATGGVDLDDWFTYDSYGTPRWRDAADYDHNGGVDGDDQAAFLAEYGGPASAKADLNFDGAVDINDLLAFLAAYEAAAPNGVRKLYAGYE